MTLVLAKFLLSPICVVLVSMAGRRWGTKAAGTLGSLPVVGGPILLAIALANGNDFGAEAAASTVFALIALAAFVVVYVWVCGRLAPLPTLLIGFVAFLAVIAVLDRIPHTPLIALLAAWLGFWLGLKATPVPGGRALDPIVPPWWDLPMRALSALALVVTITTASAALGPELSGLLTPFPIVTSVLAVFTHAQGGRGHVTVLARSFLIGFYAYATFCFIVAITLRDLGIAGSFSLATLTCLAVQYSVFRIAGR